MREVTNTNFGILVAYLLPGFVVLLGLGQINPVIHSWLITPLHQLPTLGGFLYLTVACLACGLLVSTLRWAIVDSIHHHTGVRPPAWGFFELDQKLDAFLLLVESHYRYYQFYANTAVALGVAFGAWWIGQRQVETPVWSFIVFLIVETILFLGSRDTLRKYYRRSEELLCLQQRSHE